MPPRNIATSTSTQWKNNSEKQSMGNPTNGTKTSHRRVMTQEIYEIDSDEEIQEELHEKTLNAIRGDSGDGVFLNCGVGN